MGIPVQIVGDGIDWPAWVQAIGSVLAIFIAILVDQGAARRARDQEARAKASAKEDWETCLREVDGLVQNAARLARSDRITDELDDGTPGRLLDNAIMMIDAYLRQPPPTATLSFSLAAARSFIEVPREAIRVRRSVDPKTLERSYSRRIQHATDVRGKLAEAAREVQQLRMEYQAGML